MYKNKFFILTIQYKNIALFFLFFTFICTTAQTNTNKKYVAGIKLGITHNEANGWYFGGDVGKRLNKNCFLMLGSEIFAYRGHLFNYTTEIYEPLGAYYTFYKEKRTIGNYLALQTNLGLRISPKNMPQLSFDILPHYQYLLRTNSVFWDLQENNSKTTSDDTEVKTILSDNKNMKYIGINRHDIGINLGVNYSIGKFGLGVRQSFGFIDVGNNSYFGNTTELNTFTKFYISFNPLKQ